MDTSNLSFGLFAAHVNDLRRMWFLEHEKNRKLRDKLNRFKEIVKDLQYEISPNESQIPDANLSMNNLFNNSFQSTLEQTLNLRSSNRLLLKTLVKLFKSRMCESFAEIKQFNWFEKKFGLKVHSKNSPNCLWGLINGTEISTSARNCIQFISIEKIINLKHYQFKAQAFKYIENSINDNKKGNSGYRMRDMGLVRTLILMLKIENFNTRKSFAIMRSLPQRNIVTSHLKRPRNASNISDRSCLLRKVKRSFCMFSVLHTLQIKVYREIYSKINISINKSQKINKSDEIKNRYSYGIDYLESILSGKVLSVKTEVFEVLSLDFECTICMQEGIQSLACALSKVQKNFAFASIHAISISTKQTDQIVKTLEKIRIKILGRSFTVLKFFLSETNSNEFQEASSNLILCKVFNVFQQSTDRVKRSYFNGFKSQSKAGPAKRIEKKNRLNLSRICKEIPRFAIDLVCAMQSLSFFKQTYQTRIIRDSFLIILKTAGNSLSYSTLKSENFTKIIFRLIRRFLIFKAKAFARWKVMPRKFELKGKQLFLKYLTKLQRINEGQDFLRLSLTFRNWQHKLYSPLSPYSFNKENYSLSSLSASKDMHIKPQVKFNKIRKGPLQILK